MTDSNSLQIEREFAVVIPALNEAESVGSVIGQVSKYALAIVIDDGSTDDTYTVARSAGAHVVRHSVNKGYDAALETGLKTAIELGCKFAITLDADGQHDPSVLESYKQLLLDGFDLVVGRRDRTQRWSESLFCLVGRLIWGIHDPLCGMKGYRLSRIECLSSLNSYQSIGTELAIRLTKIGASVSQPEIKTFPRDGASRFGGGLKANIRIIRALGNGLRLSS